LNGFDIIVVGGGHAGIEAALASARLGCKTALVTHTRNEVGRMPCNPAIGGLGKGHLVREIDVLGGQMGLAIDATGIQFRVLNRRKGPAVQAPRAQADKFRYQEFMVDAVAGQSGLTIVEGDATRLLTVEEDSAQRIEGVELGDGRELRAPRVILCTGTFMRGLMHVGDRQTRGGREGADSSEGLSADLKRLGFELRRLKTGTPPRLHADHIDYDKLVPQPGEADARPFSFRTRQFSPPNHHCWLAATNERTHALIRDNLARSPLFGGIIDGQGPRYCPSIEDKVVRFADRDRHLIFLEPEGVDSHELYVNGISTSLPADVQRGMVRSIEGLEKAEITRYGYAVEYDSIPSWQINVTHETKTVCGLYLAGQIMGTSGYEEAASQGLIAGINAARSLGGQSAWIPRRNQAYMGVLADDLVTKEITEPYRMFTSRAEHRLHLRCDNAETRLLEEAEFLGLLPDVELGRLKARDRARLAIDERLGTWRTPDPSGGPKTTAAELLRRPGVGLDNLADHVVNGDTLRRELDALVGLEMTLESEPVMVEGLFTEIANTNKYSGYIRKQERLLHSQACLEELEIPPDLDIQSLGALSIEAREKLIKMRPATLGQAGRIDGVRAGDLAVLTVFLKRWREEHLPKEDES